MERRDVVIYEFATGKIASIAGRNLKPEGRHNSVESRIDCILPRLNDAHGVTDVEAGKYNVGDILKEE